jgi:hypothetical protein
MELVLCNKLSFFLIQRYAIFEKKKRGASKQLLPEQGDEKRLMRHGRTTTKDYLAMLFVRFTRGAEPWTHSRSQQLNVILEQGARMVDD